MKKLLWPLVAFLLAGCARPQMQLPPCCRAVTPLPPAAADPASPYELKSVWETDDARKVQLADFSGSPVVFSMFYTTCEGVCLITLEDLKRIEASLPASARDHVRFVLVSLDPARDNRSALGRYRAEQSLPKGRWTLLRGDPSATARLAHILGLGYGRDQSGRFVHAVEIVVLDKSGHIVMRQDGLQPNLGPVAETLTALATPSDNR